MKKICMGLISLAVLFSCAKQADDADILSPVPEGAQAVSLLGKPLNPSTPYDNVLAKYDVAKMKYEANLGDAEALIWFGRWTAYKGDMREAIRIFTKGIQKFPEDARFYRHRGHRYISIREFDRAIQDFEKAAALIEGKEDQIEPDGQPNAQNIPVSTLHTNIWYHLGLAYYLKYDLENALEAYHQGIEASTNEDMLVATTHWLYMTLRLLGWDEEAKQALDPIRTEMNVIENMAYHQLCLFYKSEANEDELTGGSYTNIMNDAAAYGLANWHLYNGRRDQAKSIYQTILEGKVWASFGYIAAEADWVREFQE